MIGEGVGPQAGFAVRRNGAAAAEAVWPRHGRRWVYVKGILDVRNSMTKFDPKCNEAVHYVATTLLCMMSICLAVTPCVWRGTNRQSHTKSKRRASPPAELDATARRTRWAALIWLQLGAALVA